MTRSILYVCLALPLVACGGADGGLDTDDDSVTTAAPPVRVQGGSSGSSGSSGSGGSLGKGGAPFQEIGACSHSVCQLGAPLESTTKRSCSVCVERVCADDPYCCSSTWDQLCVKAARTKCGLCL